jgi:hypothetical protein
MQAISREEFAQKYEREWGTAPLAKNPMEGLTRQEQEFARFMYDVLQLVDSAHYLDRSIRSLELACRVARDAAAHFAVWSSDGEKPRVQW